MNEGPQGEARRLRHEEDGNRNVDSNLWLCNCGQVLDYLDVAVEADGRHVHMRPGGGNQPYWACGPARPCDAVALSAMAVAWAAVAEPTLPGPIQVLNGEISRLRDEVATLRRLVIRAAKGYDENDWRVSFVSHADLTDEEYDLLRIDLEELYCEPVPWGTES